MLIALASAKGAPGVTTTARVLASIWPSDSILVDADPAGGDTALLSRSPAHEPLDPERGLLSLAVAARRGTDQAPVGPHLQLTDGGLDVLCGVNRPEQVAGMGPVWTTIGEILVRQPGAVVADVGRLAVGSPVTPLVTAADVLLFVVRPQVEAYAHLRERLAWTDWLASNGGGPPVGVLIVADAKDRRAAPELESLLAHSGLTNPVLGVVAHDERAAAVLGGRLDRAIDRSLLVRSARQLVEPIRGLASMRATVRTGTA